nr:helix-hairpin-helix domain-containing protein [Magnetofaba australis]
MVILGGVAATLAYNVRLEARAQTLALTDSRLRWAARGGIHLIAARILQESARPVHALGDTWRNDADFFAEQLLGETLFSAQIPEFEQVTPQQQKEEPVFGVVDESARLNINVATAEQLARAPGLSTVLAEAIIRFRNQLPGAEQAQAWLNMQKNHKQGGPPQSMLVTGPIQSLQAFAQLSEWGGRDVRAAQVDAPPLSALLTCVSSGRVNLNTAPKQVLTMLGFDQKQVAEILKRRGANGQGVAFRNMEAVVKFFLPKAFLQEGAGKSSPQMIQRAKKWRSMAPYVAVKSDTFSIYGVAQDPQRKAEQKIRATVSLDARRLLFPVWRESWK